MSAVSAIIPVYNDGERVKKLLSVLKESPHIDEVICINDGSTDTTATVLASLKGANVISYNKNRGKAFAIGQGLLHAKGQIVLFIDADVTGITDTSIESLVEPLMNGTADAVIGYRSNVLETALFRPLTGERAYFREDLLPYVKKFQDKRFGLELFLNYLYKGKRVTYLVLPGVSHSFKYTKMSAGKALKGDIFSWSDILREIFQHKNPAKFFYYAYIHKFYL